MLRLDLPHVSARGSLEGAHVPPAEVHAVVANVRPTMEQVAHHDAVARADGELGLQVGVADRDDELVHIDVLGDDLLLAGGLILRDLDRRDRVGERVGELPRPFLVALPAEERVHRGGVGEEIGDGASVRIAFDAVEEDRQAPIERFLDAGDLKIRIHLHVGLEQPVRRPEPLDGAPQA